jgi:hypothetical protein
MIHHSPLSWTRILFFASSFSLFSVLAAPVKAEYVECQIATDSARLALSIGGSVAAALAIGSAGHLAWGEARSGFRLALGITLIGNAVGMSAALFLGNAFAGSDWCTNDNYGDPSFRPLAISGWAVVAAGTILGTVDIVTYHNAHKRISLSLSPIILQQTTGDSVFGLGIKGVL